MKFGIGQSVTRLEDQRLITGHGRFTDDVALPHQAHGVAVRSPHAHARIVSVDTAPALAMPGVLAVYTHADLKAAGLGTIQALIRMKSADGKPMATPPRPALADGVVRHVGDPVAFVVAETDAQARDAAEAVAVDYEILPAVVDPHDAIAPGAAAVWPQAGNNICFDWEMGDRKATDAAFADARHVAKLSLVNNRVIVASMEPRAAIGDYDRANDRSVLYTPSQGVHSLQGQIADIFKLSLDRVRVVTGDVGGGFGMKIFLFPEQVLVVFAARRLGRPVRWVSSRAEAFLSDSQGRDHVTDAEIALDAEGRFLAVRVSTMANIGAYVSSFIALVATGGSYLLPGVYAMGAMHSRVRTVFTNTVPVDAYRGAGRPEAAYVIERLVDVAARETGLPPDEIRRRNFIRPDAMPARTAAGITYDSGDFVKNMEGAMAAADWAGVADRKAEAKARGKLRGIGMAYYVERCGGGGDEMAEIRFDQGGNATILIGNQTNGQGHETAYAQILAEKLGIPIEKVRVVQGDTDLIVYGRGTGGSRALPIGGNAVMYAADRVVARGKQIAAHQLEAAEADIEFADGRFAVAGTDRAMSFTDVVRLAFTPHKLPPGIAPGLDERANFMPKEPTFPNGCHICEIEIDPETGQVTVDRFTVVDDFGRVVNPLLLAGQVHGGIAQGIGQALLERTVYDRDSGQLLSGSFIDYALPRADELPNYGFSYNEILCRNNPLGIKGAGEAGAIGAPPAVINAIVDALSARGIHSIDMPATPERVWRALQGA